MLRPISDERRRSLLQLAACICGGALSLLFLTGSPSFTARADQVQQAATITVPPVPDRLAFPSVDVGHDPFIPRVVPASSIAAASPPSTDDIGIVLPPNAGAGAGNPAGTGFGGVPVVRAVVVGASARALIEASGSVEVMQVGDALGASTIASIDASGVTLASGTHFPLAKERQ